MAGLLGWLPAPARAAEPGLPLTVVTFNVFHGGPFSALTGDDGDLERRLELTVRELRALAPDIVGLQEASASGRRGNVAARLAAALGLHHVHAPTTHRVLGIPLLGRLLVWLLDFEEGPAILSRFPITASEVHPLPRCLRWLDPRVVLGATVVTPLGPLQVFATHTSPDECQVRRVGKIVRARGDALPVILTADLNLPPHSDAVAALADHGLVDAFAVARPGTPAATVYQRIRAATSTVTRRVDYVFVRRGRALVPEVRGSRVVLATPARLDDGGQLWPSDHHGVVARIALLPAPRPAATGGR